MSNYSSSSSSNNLIFLMTNSIAKRTPSFGKALVDMLVFGGYLLLALTIICLIYLIICIIPCKMKPQPCGGGGLVLSSQPSRQDQKEWQPLYKHLTYDI